MKLSPPTNVSAVAISPSVIQVSWSPSPDAADTTVILRGPSAAGPWDDVADLGSNLTSFKDDGLAPGSTWFYVLAAQKRKQLSGPSPIVSATTPSGGSISVSDTEAVPGTLSSRNQVPFDGGTEAFVWQGIAGTQVRFQSPGSSLDAPFQGAGQYVLSLGYDQSKGRVVSMSLEMQSQFCQFVVNGGPTFKFGDANSRPQGLVKLKSGGFAGVWVQQNSGAVGLAYLSPAGAFSTVTTSFPETSALPPQSAIGQHPADDSIWAFVGRDSTGLIRAVRARESGGTLVIDWTQKEFLGFIDNNKLDDTCPNGELPHIEVAPDAGRGLLHVAYQSHHQQIFSTSPFVKGAWIAVASVNADTTKTFSFWQGWAERISHFGFVANPLGLFLATSPLDIPTLTFPKLNIVQLQPGTSGAGTVLLARPTASAISSLSARSWLTDKDQSGKCHRLALVT